MAQIMSEESPLQVIFELFALKKKKGLDRGRFNIYTFVSDC